MKIGIFSKLGASGGSEHRVAEMANAIVKYTDNEVTILCEDNINEHIEKKLDGQVKIIRNVFKPHKLANPDAIYGYDSLLIVNSDSYSFARADYWHGKMIDKKTGKPRHHTFKIDLSKIKQMVFLFNFVISPAQWIDSITKDCKDVRIIVANQDFWNQIEYKNKLASAKNLPRMFLESPIDPGSIIPEKTKSDKIRIGKHSKAHTYKHNEEWPKLVDIINKRYGDRVAWDLLGVPSEYQSSLSKFGNVVVRPEYSIPVGKYLQEIDIFCFFISWGRQEPWARCVAEGMMAGCPILATNKAGNKDQVINGINGYLCDTVEEFADNIAYLIDNPDVVNRMRDNNVIISQGFTPDKIIKKFVDFIKGT